MTIFVILAGLLALATAGALAAPLLRKPAGDESVARKTRFASVAAIGLIPVAAALLYATVGAPAALNPAARVAPQPSASGQAEAIAALPPEERAAMIANMVEGLAARLADNPDDLGGWRMLARSYGTLGRHGDAANAWREALALSKGSVDDWRGLALALVEEQGADGAENGLAIKEAFEEVLLQAPDDPLALYFLGHTARAEGNNDRAFKLWTELRKQLPEGSPFTDEVDGLIAEVKGS